MKYGHSVLIFFLLLLAASCGENHEQMLLQLEELERQNRADSVMTNDSLAEALVSYFNAHGTANEQLRAHYILGRTYADMGNSPDALKTYHSAIDKCDTLLEDCDFILLSKVYGQMAEVYKQHKLHRYALSANESAFHFAMRGKDTLIACVFMENQVSNYCNLGLKDSALFVSSHAVRLFEEKGDTLAANSSLAPVIMIYAERKNYPKMKELLDKYEYHSHLFEGDTLKYENQYLLYYYKGLYYTGVHQYDSAAISFQRLLGGHRSLNNKGLGSKGLYDLYDATGITDSVAYYANIYTITLDSIVSQLERSMIYKQEMLYNYSQHQQYALEMEQRANKERARGIIIAGLMLVLILLLLFYRWRSVIKMREYRVKMIAYHQMLQKNEAESKVQGNKKNEISKSLFDSEIRKRLLDKAFRNECATDEDWSEATHLIEQTYPGFNDTLYGFLPSVNSTHLRICLGIKLQFTPAQIAILVCRSRQAVTSARSRMYREVFAKNGKPSDFDDFILSIS